MIEEIREVKSFEILILARDSEACENLNASWDGTTTFIVFPASNKGEEPLKHFDFATFVCDRILLILIASVTWKYLNCEGGRGVLHWMIPPYIGGFAQRTPTLFTSRHFFGALHKSIYYLFLSPA